MLTRVSGNRKSSRKLKLLRNRTWEALFAWARVSLSEGVRDACGIGGLGGPAISETRSEYGVYHRAVTMDSPAFGKMCWFHMCVPWNISIFTWTASKSQICFYLVIIGPLCVPFDSLALFLSSFLFLIRCVGVNLCCLVRPLRIHFNRLITGWIGYRQIPAVDVGRRKAVK